MLYIETTPAAGHSGGKMLGAIEAARHREPRQQALCERGTLLSLTIEE